MTDSPPELAADPPPGEAPSGTLEPGAGVTRISAAWVAIGVSLLVLVLLLIFILQNLQQVRIHFVGLSGRIPLGLALLIAAVGGGVVVAVSGTLRVLQLRRAARKG